MFLLGFTLKMCSDVPPHGIYYLVELEDGIIGMGALHQLREKQVK